MKKKLISAMIYIYIAVVVGVIASAETITCLGVSFPFQGIKKGEYRTLDYEGEKIDSYDGTVTFTDYDSYGFQGTIKVRHIFDNSLVFGGDFDIGQSMYKIDKQSKVFDLNFDLDIGYAIVNTERFTLIPSIVIGLHHQKQNLGSYTYYYQDSWTSTTITCVERYTAFEVGGELFANFRIGDIAGLFASCKVLYNIGNFRGVYDTDIGTFTDRIHKTKAILVKPSVGVSFTF